MVTENKLKIAQSVARLWLSVGQTITLACDSNPTKVIGSERLIPHLQIMLDGYRKVDPATCKKLPVQSNVPELLVETAYQQVTTQRQRATVDLTMIAFYYLLRVGKYTVKGSWNNTKQTVQFKYKDLTFFRKNNRGELRCLPWDAPAHLISSADGATLKLDKQKNGWKGVCVYHELNDEACHCPVRTLACCHIHLHNNGADIKTFLSAYYDDKGQRSDITNEDVSKALKAAATVLEYPTAKGIPIDHIDTHLLRSGGANALSLSGYSDTQIQKMGQWWGATLKEYIREEMACISKGMSKSMKKKFDFINISGNTFNTITDDLIDREYKSNVSAASAA
jgi:hypothetical protein